MYAGRADNENRIKELKEHLSLDTFCLQSFDATDANCGSVGLGPERGRRRGSRAPARAPDATVPTVQLLHQRPGDLP